ncbi:MAG TPA: (Fe-S)-binding protein [Spirochaetota bacterium]|nr:(Fe-S)-binding protein [Spirochaetota bacterium]HOS38902.1 (Fe-S)-binding protein [Spirochaetota bacterium]HPU88221.1 (Fe-S)-binding protein [Spirochaetota bacterium]
MKIVTTFPRRSEYEKMAASLTHHGIPFEEIDAGIAYGRVGVAAIILDAEARSQLAAADGSSFLCAGWVDHHGPSSAIPSEQPPSFVEDLFGDAVVMVLAPCTADPKKIRVIAHTTKDMSPAFPYLNATMREGCYNPDGPLFTFMDCYRMITLYPQRIAAAKADDIVDAWRMLEKIRRRVNEVYADRASLQPSYETRKKPPALEIYRRLPGTNCRECGEKTCMAFALQLWNGNQKPESCAPLFSGEHQHLRSAYIEICAGLGFLDLDAREENV